MRSTIRLSRKQIDQLSEIADKFDEASTFTLSWEQEQSGIGLGISVKFQTFDPDDTTIDITDVESW
jgi:hypothetical protein